MGSFHWDILLTSIEEGRVVPVLGPELSRISLDGRSLTLHQWLAEQLVERLGELAGDPPRRMDLDGVAGCFLDRGGNRALFYSTLHSISSAASVPVPDALRKLARVQGLRLFVNTTFDCLMERALDEERHSGQRRTPSLAFSLRTRREDIPCEPRLLDLATVFHIFGRSSTAADYAVTDEDLLEFVHVLQTGDRRPTMLFDALRDSNLLVLGCSFPDWLTRFFVRAISDMRLIEPRGTLETIVDDHTPQDATLVEFLRRFKFHIYQDSDTAGFIDELCHRWEERHPASAPAPAPAEADTDAGRLSAGGIFLSYASEDREPVLEIKRCLESVGLEVWYDQRRLEAGDVYERKIRRNIEACSFFFPVISAASCSRLEGYYRKEWFWAIERSRRFDPTFPFIQPIVIDDTPYDADGVPEEFSNRHWQRFPGGAATGEFLELTRQRIRELRKREAGRS